jgi:hypothetical protein
MLDRKESSPKKLWENQSNIDLDKVIEKVNNHKRVITPNFSKMTARPFEGPLPFYMQVRLNLSRKYITELLLIL